ncbi:alpha/beta fold hydrolase [Rhodoferax koreensis]|nr:alpha/beta fold hydrolase [Rhodoferax koreense]
MSLPQLVLIPGLACDAQMWRAPLDVLPVALRPMVSDVHTRLPTIETMAQALLDEHPGELLLCGASMGGMIAMQAAHLGGARVRGLVLIGTSARPETAAMRQLREGVLNLFAQGRAAEVLRANIPLALAPRHAADPVLAQAYLSMMLRAGDDQLTRQNRAVMARPDLRPHLPALRCATLVLCGDMDRLAPPEHSREIAGLVPGAELRMLAGCGHMPTMEAPEPVNREMLAWLRSAFAIGAPHPPQPAA